MWNLTRNKPLAKKLRLSKATKQNRSTPAWIWVRTGGRVRGGSKRRRWRTSKIKP